MNDHWNRSATTLQNLFFDGKLQSFYSKIDLRLTVKSVDGKWTALSMMKHVNLGKNSFTCM